MNNVNIYNNNIVKFSISHYILFLYILFYISCFGKTGFSILGLNKNQYVGIKTSDSYLNSVSKRVTFFITRYQNK